jgi:hypothetical protein
VSECTVGDEKQLFWAYIGYTSQLKAYYVICPRKTLRRCECSYSLACISLPVQGVPVVVSSGSWYLVPLAVKPVASSGNLSFLTWRGSEPSCFFRRPATCPKKMNTAAFNYWSCLGPKPLQGFYYREFFLKGFDACFLCLPLAPTEPAAQFSYARPTYHGECRR